MSIKWRINLLLIMLGICACLGYAALSYYKNKTEILNDAFKKAELISSFADATRKFTAETALPITLKIANPNSFHPELLSGHFVARNIGFLFSKDQPGYYFKAAAVNPVNSANQATAHEAELIRFFAEHPDVKQKGNIINQTDGTYIYTAHPIIVEKSCLKCHGSKETVLPGRVIKYPGPGGYDYKLDSVIATFVTYVTIQKAMENLKTSTLRTTLIGAACILLLAIILWFFISSLITRPLARLTRLANEISQGKEIHRTITSKRTDEIGDLYKSFERMRISVINLVKTIPKRKKSVPQ